MTNGVGSGVWGVGCGKKLRDVVNIQSRINGLQTEPRNGPAPGENTRRGPSHCDGENRPGTWIEYAWRDQGGSVHGESARRPGRIPPRAHTDRPGARRKRAWRKQAGGEQNRATCVCCAKGLNQPGWRVLFRLAQEAIPPPARANRRTSRPESAVTEPAHTSSSANLAFSSMNSRRGCTSAPIRSSKISLA